MTELEAFALWWETESYISKESYFRCWQACAERKDAEISALKEFAVDYLDDLKNDTSYRSADKEKRHREYIARLQELIKE